MSDFHATSCGRNAKYVPRSGRSSAWSLSRPPAEYRRGWSRRFGWPRDADTGPRVSFARSGVSVHWKDSEYQSVLELAEACDVPLRWSCRTGVCHACESGLVAGAISYRPDPIDAPAEGNL